MADSARKLVEDVLGPGMTREIWSGNYDKVLPVSVQPFELSAILPTVFYMFRFGHRRGRGKFIETFGLREGLGKPKKTIGDCRSSSRKAFPLSRVRKVSMENPIKAILGDLLLCFCLENIPGTVWGATSRSSGSHRSITWRVGLTCRIACRLSAMFPEMIVAMLANQKGESVEQSDNKKTRFPVRRRFEENVLLGAFSQGVTRHGEVLSELNIGWVRGGKRIYRLRPTVDDSARAWNSSRHLTRRAVRRQPDLQSTPHCRAGGAEFLR